MKIIHLLHFDACKRCVSSWKSIQKVSAAVERRIGPRARSTLQTEETSASMMCSDSVDAGHVDPSLCNIYVVLLVLLAGWQNSLIRDSNALNRKDIDDDDGTLQQTHTHISCFIRSGNSSSNNDTAASKLAVLRHQHRSRRTPRVALVAPKHNALLQLIPRNHTRDKHGHNDRNACAWKGARGCCSCGRSHSDTGGSGGIVLLEP